MRKITTLLGFLVISACSSDKKPDNDGVITANDFEAVAGWNSDLSLLEKNHTHSGQYAIKVDRDHEYSFTYQMPLSAINNRERIKTLHLEAWAYLISDKSNGDLVVQIVDPAQKNKAILYDAIKLGDEVKTYNTWVKVSKDIVVPDSVVAAHQLQLYLWRNSATEPIYLDDVKLSAGL